MMVFVKSASMALFFMLALATSIIAADGFSKGQAVVETPSGQQHVLQVEYAMTAEEREQGLMGRTSLKPDEGMIFDFSRTQQAIMWMKNTPLSLDMLFVDEKGVVTHIAKRTTPYSEDLIPSEGLVRYVIELNGGRAEALGIQKGSRFVKGLQPPK
ncbi:uncharacterized membrane protein (UPF0127 family) [Agrobacterium vitis]|nr:uncharacterized membrane protein (UPF0127 family) [Agrobacterium vitis]MBE1440422.1 uncharacterized membrane protein (UPF0127 family) [Agrobacterium vitis]